MKQSDIPDEVHAVVSAILKEKDDLKELLVRSVVELQNLSIWIMGDRKRSVCFDDHPTMQELPDDIQQSVIELRKAKYGIE